MTQANSSLIGSVFERTSLASSSGSGKFSSPGKTGFPAVQHRSKSAFARGRDELRKNSTANSTRLKEAPVVTSFKDDSDTQSAPQEQTDAGSSRARLPDVNSIQSHEDWRLQTSEENERRVESMTEQERESERKDIMERFGVGVGDLLKRAKEAREAREKQISKERVNRDGVEGSREQLARSVADKLKVERSTPLVPRNIPGASRNPSKSPPPSPRPILSTSSTRPSSRAGLKIRFADVTPENVHYYESAPPSPRMKALALPPPPDIPDGSIVSLGKWKGKMHPQTDSIPAVSGSAHDERPQQTAVNYVEREPEEGTPEYIRQRFFPNVPANDPNLAWMESSAPDSTSAPSSVRFDFTGTPIPPSLASSLPTHLGLHHHAEGSQAGYTLDDIFLLSRSTVPAQRATMMEVLARIARKLGRGKKDENSEEIRELEGQEKELRKRIVAAGVEAMAERGSLGALAVGVIWECIVKWDEGILDIEGVELKDGNDVDENFIFSLPLEHIFSRISDAFATIMLPYESLQQLLAIVHRLAQYSNNIATTIVTTPNLVTNLVRSFLLTPIPPTDSSQYPNILSLRLLNTLALSSRSNASALAEPSDALLRFVTMLPPHSPYPDTLAADLLTSTLRLYITLASYGLYSHIASTASIHFAQLGTYILSDQCQSRRLMEVWPSLLEAWMVCATDPHRTTPSHEILWSQVVGWGWVEDVLELRKKLRDDEQDSPIWASLWKAEAAWLEGARVNGTKAGEKERSAAIERLSAGFESGPERTVVLGVVGELRRNLDKLDFDDRPGTGKGWIHFLRGLSSHANVLTSAIRLWLACVPPLAGGPIASPPFQLPFLQLSELCARLVSHPLWAFVSSKSAPSYSYVFCRPLNGLLSFFLRLSRRLPSTSEDLWMAQTFSLLTRLLPGDEEFGCQIVSDVGGLITANFMASRGWQAPSIIWERGGMDIITPFLTHAFRPQDLYIGPLHPSPLSISLSTTQRLPCRSRVYQESDLESSLPLTRDWMFSPIDHLLRSGSSSVIKSLPSSWDVSEIEVVRATLVLAMVVRGVLQRHGLTDFVPTREELIFACMKIFMLEHEQSQSDSQEVFRDNIVGRFMGDLLAPFTLAALQRSTTILPSADSNLETVASRFLGSSTPFYQYYTDFLGLYDAVSFSHPLFARLLLPPTSMRYASDYRRHLWNDFKHVLKTIRTPIDQVIGALSEYLQPAEDDPQMIGCYLRALLTGPLQNFVRLVAIHHIACNIWPDLGSEGGKERTSRLLGIVVDQGDVNAVREIVLYRQVKEGRLLVPPQCFEQAGEWKASRMEYIAQLGDENLTQRLSGLLVK